MSTFLQVMGIRIVRRRKELGLSQEAVAELAGLTTQTISTAERGVKAMRPENIVKLCAALRVTPNDLLLGESVSDAADAGRLSKLTPEQRASLDQIVSAFLNAVCPQNKEK